VEEVRLKKQKLRLKDQMNEIWPGSRPRMSPDRQVRQSGSLEI